MPIHDVEQRWSRAGKLKIGEKVDGLPKKLDHFRIDTENENVARAFFDLYGDSPKEVPVMFFDEDLEFTFPHHYLARRGSRIWCKGDNREARRQTKTPGEFKDQPYSEGFVVECNDDCPYRQRKDMSKEEKKQRFCNSEGTLRFLLPEMPTIQFFEIRVAPTSIGKILTFIKLFREAKGRIAFFEFKLQVVPFQANVGKGTQTVYGLQLDIAKSFLQLAQERPAGMLSAPEGMPEEGAPFDMDGKPMDAEQPETPAESPGGDEASAPPKVAAKAAKAPEKSRKGQSKANKGKTKRGSFFDPTQRKAIKRMLDSPVFEKDRDSWLAGGQKVTSQAEAARFVEGLASAFGIRTKEAKAAEAADDGAAGEPPPGTASGGDSPGEEGFLAGLEKEEEAKAATQRQS